MGDPLLVRQSLINLIQNALRYTQQGGVLIAIRPRGAECLVEVWDTGVGIADEEKSKIFSPYYRPELAWKIDSAGHGLGLAVVARCAKLMKVKYGMHSVEGKGSRFWMRFTQYIGEDKAPETAAAYDNTATPIRYAPLRGACWWWTTILGDLRTGEPDEHGASPCAARPPPRKPSPSSTTALRRSPCCATSACVPARAVSTSSKRCSNACRT